MTFLVFSPTGKQFATSTPSGCGIHSLVFARHYIAECEDRHGVSAVERLLDACHALLSVGVDRFKRTRQLSLAREAARQKERSDYQQTQGNDLWRTLPQRT